MEYRVIWEVDIDANSPREAAEEALKMQRDPDSIATVFMVEGDKGLLVRVDLLGDDE